MKTLRILCLSFFVFSFSIANAMENVTSLKSKYLESSKFTSRSASKEIIEGGFFFHFGGFIPSKNYLFPSSFDNPTNDKYGLGLDIELGNMFSIFDFDDMAIGLRVSWLNIGYTSWREDGEVYSRVIQGSIARIGPYFTYGLTDDMGIDVFYQAGVTYLLEMDDEWDNHEDKGALGVTHEVGIGYRYKILSVILGYRFGKIMSLDYEDFWGDKSDFRLRTTNFRFAVGVKF